MQLKLVVGFLVVSLGIFLIGFGSFKLAQPNRAGLQVITGDKPVSVFLNDRYLDQTPLVEKKLKPGVYTVRLEPEDRNLVSYDTEISLHPGTLTVMTWHPETTTERSGGVIYEMMSLTNQRQTRVNFTSIPDKAVIKVDNLPTDFTPLTLDELEPGQHRYTVSLPSYETQQNSFELQPGYQIDVIVKLAQSTEAIELENQPTPQPTPQLGISPASQSAQVNILKTNYYQDDVEVLRVRQEPNQNSQQIGTVTVGQKYPLIQEKAGWYQIKFEDQVGWISAAYAQKDLHL